jgi:TadE-like protein
MKILIKIKRIREHSGQSLVELALILPLILLMLAGMVEVAFGMFAYLTALDLTREAARFASVRDYHELNPTNELHPAGYVADAATACNDDVLHYYYDAACFFTDTDLNPFLEFNPAKYDDLVITVFTVVNHHVSVSPLPDGRHPGGSDSPSGPGYWSLYNDNWQKDCQGNVVSTTPFFTNAVLEDSLISTAPKDVGVVTIEAYICYDLIMHLPFISNFIPSPFRIHAYTVMPAPEAIPTPTPIP